MSEPSDPSLLSVVLSHLPTWTCEAFNLRPDVHAISQKGLEMSIESIGFRVLGCSAIRSVLAGISPACTPPIQNLSFFCTAQTFVRAERRRDKPPIPFSLESGSQLRWRISLDIQVRGPASPSALRKAQQQRCSRRPCCLNEPTNLRTTRVLIITYL